MTNNKFSNYSKEFFNKCVSKRLKEEEIEFSNDGKTVLKLSVLPLVVNKNLSAKMYGYYDGSNEILYTEYLLGGVNACMGFIKAKESGETDDALREKYFDTLNSFVEPKLQRGSDNNIVAGNKYAATVVYGQRIQRGYRPY